MPAGEVPDLSDFCLRATHMLRARDSRPQPDAREDPSLTITTHHKSSSSVELLFAPLYAIGEVASLIAEVLGTDKVDAFQHEPETDMLLKGGPVIPDAPSAARDRTRSPAAGGWRASGLDVSHAQPGRYGRVDEDPEELVGVKRGLTSGRKSGWSWTWPAFGVGC